MLYLNGYDLRKLPLFERKTLLKKIIAETDIQFSESFEVDGGEMYKHTPARPALRAPVRLASRHDWVKRPVPSVRRRPAGRCRIDAIEPEVAEFQRINEPIDRANRIALADPIIEAFRQQCRLLAIRPLTETLHHSPADSARES